MNPEDRQLLEETFELSKENNKLLKKIHRSAKIAQAMQIIYWLVIVGFTVGAFYFVQPYLEQLLSVYTGVQDGVGKVQDFLR